MHRLMFKMAAVAAVGTFFLAAALAATNDPGATPGKRASSAAATVEIAYLRPFTNVAEIPAGSDLSSIRLEGIKAVKVATRRIISTTDKGYCAEGYRAPGGSMYCPSVQDGSFVPAYQITYSYNGPALGGDEYGSTHFTFSVNMRREDLDPAVIDSVSAHRVNRTVAAESLKLTTYRSLVPQIVIDEANSAFCAGNYVDDLWTQTDRNCEEKVTFKTVAVPSGYIAVRVDATAGAPVTTASR